MRDQRKEAGPGRLSRKATLKPWSEVRRELLSDPEVAFEFDQLRIRQDAAKALVLARKETGITQLELAERIGTTQSVIARLETAKGGIPSLTLLDRVATALGLQMSLRFQRRRAA